MWPRKWQDDSFVKQSAQYWLEVFEMVPPPRRQIQLSGGSRRTLHVFGDAAEEPALSGGMPKVTCCFWFVDVASGIKRGGVSVIPWQVLKMFKNRATIANPFVRYVSRRTTGFVMDFDDDVSHTMLIYDGYALPQAILRLNSASRVFSVCRFLSRPPLREAIGRDVHAKLWYSSFDCNTQLKSTVLSDGDIISVVDDECFRCESIFKPSGIGKEASGIHVFFFPERHEV